MAWRVWVNKALEAKIECIAVLGSISWLLGFTCLSSVSARDPKGDGFPMAQEGFGLDTKVVLSASRKSD